MATIKYFSLSESEIGSTTQDIPEGSTEITYSTYLTLKAAMEAATEEFIESLESS